MFSLWLSRSPEVPCQHGPVRRAGESITFTHMQRRRHHMTVSGFRSSLCQCYKKNLQTMSSVTSLDGQLPIPSWKPAKAATYTLGHFNSLSLRPQIDTKQPNFGLRPELRLTNHCGAHCSLNNVIADVIADVSVFVCLFMNKRKSEVIFVHQNFISN